MITSNIKEIMELNFGLKDNYNEEDYSKITELSIDRFNVVGELNNIDFQELLLFKNLESLTIKQCIIDDNIMNIILELKSLTSLSFDDCEIVDDLSNFFERLSINNLVLNNTYFEYQLLEKIYLKNLYLYNIEINKDLVINTYKLDISNCIINDGVYIDINNVENLVISIEQYQHQYDFINNYHGHLIIMEENGQFVKKEGDV